MTHRPSSAARPRATGRALSLVGVALLLSGLGRATAQAQAGDPAPAGSDSAAFTPNIAPTLEVTRARAGIVVDGRLDDPGWSGAARARNFAEHWPVEQGRPEVPSEVWVTYDDRHLYVGFLAFDEPGSIRASLRDRDQMWSDDYFGILLDTYGDATWAYFLFSNPLGVQGDTRFATASGEDAGFDIIFHTEAVVTDSGYQIEMAIPFASLRFPDRDVQTWRATFWRTRPRGSREQHTWAALDRDDPCFLCQFGTLTGIEGVRPGGALELLPSAVVSQAGALDDADDPSSSFDNRSVEGDVSLGARYAFAGGVTAEVTVNPDFSQVESDVAQIDVNTTFALFFPERRPFFQEGGDLFDTFFDVVYTRQINNPLVATKIVGRAGRTTVAYMGARDETSPILLPFEERSFVGEGGRSWSNILRLRQTFLRDSYAGVTLTDRRFDDGGSGTAGGVDGQVRFLEKYRFQYQVLGSRTREPNDTALTSGLNGETFDRGAHTAAFDGEAFGGWATYTSVERSARTWNFEVTLWQVSPTFRVDNGFETRNDIRRLSMWQGLSLYPGTKLIDEVTPNLFVLQDWNFAGRAKRTLVRPGVRLHLTKQTFVEVLYSVGSERFADVEFDGFGRWQMFVNSNFSDPVRLGFFLAHGESIFRDRDDPRLGRGTDVEVFAVFKPFSRLVIEPSVNYSELDGPNGDELFSGYIVRARTNLQFTRELFLRLVIQYNDFAGRWDFEPLLTYKVNPFTLFFVGSTVAYRDYDDPDRFAQTSRQFFAKFQYLIRR